MAEHPIDEDVDIFEDDPQDDAFDSQDDPQDDTKKVDLSKDDQPARKSGLVGLSKGRKPKDEGSKKSRKPKPSKPKDDEEYHASILLKTRRKPRDPLTLKKALRALRRWVAYWAPWVATLGAPFVLADRSAEGTKPVEWLRDYYEGHLGLLLIVLVPILLSLTYMGRNYMRTHPPQQKGRARRDPRPALPSITQRNRDIADIVANLDHIVVRVVYVILFVGAVYASSVLYPASVDDFASLGSGDQEMIRAVAMSLLGPLVLYGFIHLRTSAINRSRQDMIGQVYAIARDTLGYPKLTATMMKNGTPRQRTLLTPWQSINVKRWSTLEDIDLFFVLAPEELSVEDVSKWDDFDTNLNAKLPREEEWRVQRDPRGRGATVGPANYPLAVLWDGEYDQDPLTFYLGENLETGGRQTLTFGEVSPHAAVSGGTSSGKLLELSTKLPTPRGFRTVGDLSVGDEVFAPDGAPTKVTALSLIEEKPHAYRVTFHDDTWVDVDAGHLWTTWDRPARRAAGRQRKRGDRARRTWLTEEQQTILAAELEETQPGEDITVQQAIALVSGERMLDRPFYETARAIGACRTQQRTMTFHYAEQVVEQEQVCTVFDREHVQALVERLANSKKAELQEAAGSVKVLERNGSGPVTLPELVQVTGFDRTRMRMLVKRSGVPTRQKRVKVRLAVAGRQVERKGCVTDEFYPKRPFLKALMERGHYEGGDQRHLMSMPKVRTTQEIADTLRYRAADAGEGAPSWANHSIPRTKPVQFPERSLPMDPYTLGAWLGDGSTGCGGFTGIDPEIWEQFEAVGYEVSHYSNGKSHTIKGAISDLRALGVLKNKHVPNDYLTASIPQRLALLQGLMDTDGSVNRTSETCEFYSSDESLARQVRSLVASLGMIAHLRSKPGGYRDAQGQWVECKEAWTITFTPTMQVFRLSRKASLIDPEAMRAKSEHRYIVSVERIDPVPMRCIMVDSDTHQFLVTDQYVPTHNTSLAEVIAAQCLIKPMPWDPDLHGVVVVVDPKGPFARRWAGRPGVVVANGQEDAAEPDEDGEPITGIVVMSSAMQWLEVEHQRRQSVLGRYRDVGTWIHLPDEVKRKERFFPILVILDEYIDHTDKEKANGDERIEAENQARDTITRLAGWHARKYRNVGMHTILIAQEVKMTGNTGIGSALMRQLPVRAVTGQMDPSQLLTMFGTAEVPNLPATRVVIENGERRVKTIPGRARIMNAMGQQIHKVQISWFGGDTNMGTLDKWLPRGEVPPNGDFSLPTGRPRSRDDFDGEGNFIGVDSPKPVADAVDDLPMDTNEPSARDFDPDDALPDESEGDWGFSDVPSATDPDAVFPAATATVPRCAHEEGCVNDADRKCPSCEQVFCQYHLMASPDPEERGLACSACVAEHALLVSGVADVYRVMHSLGRAAGLVPSYEVPDEGTVLAVLRTPRNKKVIEVRGQGGNVIARSRSGEVQGEDDVLDRIETAITSYEARRSSAAASEES